ncbi:MAG: selenium-dependent molybdenum cofactor biosynthesis protein YqeB [Candidatus Adiutrix sp.]
MATNYKNPNSPLIVIKGAGDLATGVAHRLHRSGYRLLLAELSAPTAIRTTVSFSQAVYKGSMTVEGITATVATLDDFAHLQSLGHIPILTAPLDSWLKQLNPAAIIEATLSKKNTGISRQKGRVTLALGPGYAAGTDVDAVVETARGHWLGRLILKGEALANTGCPGLIGGYDAERLIKSPSAGAVCFKAVIGQKVVAGEVLGQVGASPIIAPISGVLRGALFNGLTVPLNFKIGDIDPRLEAHLFIHSPSDKARAVAGGVLEGLLYFNIYPT